MIGLALLLAAQASQPASQPAQVGARPEDIYAELTLIIEPGEGALLVQEGWRLRNRSDKALDARDLRLPTPAGATRLRLQKEVPGFAVTEDGSAIYATAPLSGEASVDVSYDVPGAASLARQLPFELGGARVIFERLPGLRVTANVPLEQFERQLDSGLEFMIWQSGPVARGARLELGFDGLPRRTTWARDLALAICGGILLWMVFALTRPRTQVAVQYGALSARARRDRLVRAIEILDGELAAGTIEPERHKRRLDALLRELAGVLREVEAQERSGKAA